MDLILVVRIYGFGSYFTHSTNKYQDIDLLIVHNLTDYASCLQVISLKKSLIEKIEKADVTILSESSELHFRFIETAQAVLIYEFEGLVKQSTIAKVVNKICEHRIKR